MCVPDFMEIHPIVAATKWSTYQETYYLLLYFFIYVSGKQAENRDSKTCLCYVTNKNVPSEDHVYTCMCKLSNESWFCFPSQS